jgi:hypothetical protein
MKAYKRVCVDLFSGLGGFSQAFLDRGWTVYRYDNDKQFSKVPCTHIVDVLELTPEIIKGEHKEIDIILASPPCTCFSCAGVWKYWPDNRPTREVFIHLEFVKYALALIYEISPKYWVMENPQGKLKSLIGPPVVITFWGAWGKPYLKPTHLWGKIPAIDWPTPPRLNPLRESSHGKHLGVQAGTRDLVNYRRSKFSYDAPRAASLRSLIPYDFSKALCESIEQNRGGQLTLLEILE